MKINIENNVARIKLFIKISLKKQEKNEIGLRVNINEIIEVKIMSEIFADYFLDSLKIQMKHSF